MKNESNAFRFEVAMVRHTVTLQCLHVGSPLHYSSQIQFQILAPSDLRMSRFRYSSFERNMMRLAAAFVGEDNISGVKARIFPDARSPCFPSAPCKFRAHPIRYRSTHAVQ